MILLINNNAYSLILRLGMKYALIRSLLNA